MKVTNYGYSNNTAVFDFDDNSKLLMVPYVDRTRIAGLACVALYKDRLLGAIGIDAPYKFMDKKDSGFWTKGSVTQRELSEYMKLAIAITNDLFDAYMGGKIGEQEFERKYRNLYVIADYSRQYQGKLEMGNERIFPEKPSGFGDSI